MPATTRPRHLSVVPALPEDDELIVTCHCATCGGKRARITPQAGLTMAAQTPGGRTTLSHSFVWMAHHPVLGPTQWSYLTPLRAL